MVGAESRQRVSAKANIPPATAATASGDTTGSQLPGRHPRQAIPWSVRTLRRMRLESEQMVKISGLVGARVETTHGPGRVLSVQNVSTTCEVRTAVRAGSRVAPETAVTCKASEAGSEYECGQISVERGTRGRQGSPTEGSGDEFGFGAVEAERIGDCLRTDREVDTQQVYDGEGVRYTEDQRCTGAPALGHWAAGNDTTSKDILEADGEVSAGGGATSNPTAVEEEAERDTMEKETGVASKARRSLGGKEGGSDEAVQMPADSNACDRFAGHSDTGGSSLGTCGAAVVDECLGTADQQMDCGDTGWKPIFRGSRDEGNKGEPRYVPTTTGQLRAYWVFGN